MSTVFEMVRLDERDVRAWGLQVSDVRGVLGPPDETLQTTPVADRAGVVLLSGQPQVAPRQVEIVGFVDTDEPAHLDAALVALDRATRGVRRITTAHAPDRAFTGLRLRLTITIAGAPFVATRADVVVSYLCADPYAYDLSVRTVGLSTTPAALALGTAASAPDVVVFGAVTAPVVTTRTADGAVRGALAFVGLTLSTGDWLTIPGGQGTATVHRAAGTVIDAVPFVTDSTRAFFPVLSPGDGDPAGADWPTLELSGGTGLALYRRAW
jgi:hypothetical protein